jgi:hypothetical protein
MYISTNYHYKLKLCKALNNLPPEMIKTLRNKINKEHAPKKIKDSKFSKKWLKSHFFSIFL